MEGYLPLGFQLGCLVTNDHFYLPVPLNVMVYAFFSWTGVTELRGRNLLLAKTTVWFGWWYWILWYACASSVTVSVGYGWPFMQCLSKWIICIWIWLYSHYSLVSKYWHLITQVLKKRCLFLEQAISWALELRFFFSHVAQVAVLVSETSTSSDQKFCSRRAFTTETDLHWLPGSFILSPLRAALSYLGKLPVGSATSGWGAREVARVGSHAEAGLQWSRSLGKTPFHSGSGTAVCSGSGY